MAARLEKGSLSPEQVLREVGLGDRMQNFPAQLSGGEQQRVSIARALVKNPGLLLCDEPTGALDYETGKTILSLLQRSCRERGTTVVIITHNQALCPMADRVIRVKNGKIKSCECNPSPTPIEQIEW
jgi:putative ABC transport system ATP-binding protein